MSGGSAELLCDIEVLILLEVGIEIAVNLESCWKIRFLISGAIELRRPGVEEDMM